MFVLQSSSLSIRSSSLLGRFRLIVDCLLEIFESVLTVTLEASVDCFGLLPPLKNPLISMITFFACFERNQKRRH